MRRGLFLLSYIATLGLFWANTAERVHTQAAGSLTFSYNDLPLDGPIFTGIKLEPGNCVYRTVTAQNDSPDPQVVKVRGQGELTAPLEQELELTFGAADKTIQHSLASFFHDYPEGVSLFNLNSNSSQTIQISLCLPRSAGNDLQQQSATFDLEFGYEPVPIALPAECASLAASISKTIRGTRRGDLLLGSRASELIIGGSGNDLILGNGGNDCIVGEEGSDLLLGGPSENVLLGGPGNDLLIGKRGDLLIGGPGRDLCQGGNKQLCE